MSYSMDLHEAEDRISKLPNDILFCFVSLLELKNAAQTSIISKRWRYVWTDWTDMDFDALMLFPKGFSWFSELSYEPRKYVDWVNQVVSVHQGPSIDKFRVHFRLVPTDNAYPHLDEWFKFALSKNVKELVVDLIDFTLSNPYVLRVDILKHPPCKVGIRTLRSLHLNTVDVNGEVLEFLLSHCHHLERLFLNLSPSLFKLRVKTCKLKHLPIITRIGNFKGLEIDAENLMYFEFRDIKHYNYTPTPIVFKCVPKLVETSFGGGCCYCPFPILQQMSLFSMQLSKLSLDLRFSIRGLKIPDGVIPFFPNVKHLTCTTECSQFCCILPFKRFVEACPRLQEFKLQVKFILSCRPEEEATELQEISLEDEKEYEEPTGLLEPGFDSDWERILQNEQECKIPGAKLEHDERSHQNLRLLEVVGFLGAHADVGLALAIVGYARSLKTIICDPRGYGFSGTHFFSESIGAYNVAWRRARKLARILAPKVKVIMI